MKCNIVWIYILSIEHDAQNAREQQFRALGLKDPISMAPMADSWQIIYNFFK